MKSLSEIEEAVDSLPRQQKQKLLDRLAKQLRTELSCYDLVKELFEEPGRLGSSGIPDLSTNREHLKGYGTSRGDRLWK